MHYIDMFTIVLSLLYLLGHLIMSLYSLWIDIKAQATYRRERHKEVCSGPLKYLKATKKDI